VNLADLEPVDVRPLMILERAELLALLERLDDDRWAQPTVCPGWSVKDVCLHILDDDLGWLSRQRDNDHTGLLVIGDDYRMFVAALNAKNERWMQGARPLSHRIIRDLLRVTGAQVDEYFATIPLDDLSTVAWVGPQAIPKWFDLARDFTERWVHQQQIRDAVGEPGLDGAEWIGPVLRTFVWSLPRAYQEETAAEGTVVTLHVAGPGGGEWSLHRSDGEWSLAEGSPRAPAAAVTMSSDTAWRLFTGARRESDAVVMDGDPLLANPMLHARGIIV
jgi:uncharacterized protein (TIGR03083 family)